MTCFRSPRSAVARREPTRAAGSERLPADAQAGQQARLLGCSGGPEAADSPQLQSRWQQSDDLCAPEWRQVKWSDLLGELGFDEDVTSRVCVNRKINGKDFNEERPELFMLQFVSFVLCVFWCPAYESIRYINIINIIWPMTKSTYHNILLSDCQLSISENFKRSSGVYSNPQIIIIIKHWIPRWDDRCKTHKIEHKTGQVGQEVMVYFQNKSSVY